MFVKRTHVKRGRVLTYLPLVASYRDGDELPQRVVKKLGREDQVDLSEVDRLIRSLAPYGRVTVTDDAQGEGVLEGVEVHGGLEYDSILALHHGWQALGLPGMLADLAAGRRFTFDVPSVVKAIVCSRIREPGSEHALVTRWLSRVHAPEFAGIEMQHAYRTLTFLADVGPELEARLTRVLVDPLFVDATLTLFCATSTHFEGLGPEALARHGYLRDKRGDRPQANLGLLSSREGYRLGHWRFPGRQSDVKSMALASREFRERLTLASFVVVAGRGMDREANLAARCEEGIETIIAERLRRKTSHEALARAGRTKRVTSTIDVKENPRDGAERVILCRNQERAAGDAARQAILDHLEQPLEKGSWRDSLKPAARRYLKVDGSQAHLDVNRIKRGARHDGTWVLRTTTNLPAEQVTLAYRGLWRIEDAFRTMKTPLELRPIHHTSEAGVRGHVQTCVLAYLITRILQDRLDAAHLTMNASDALDHLASMQRTPLQAGPHHLIKTTRPNQERHAILKAIGATVPPHHQAL